MKYDHTEQVVIEARGIADSLKLPHKERELVLIAAILHDVGRYRQLDEYGTFSDKKSVDHGDLSRDIVEATPTLRFLNEKAREIVYTSIAAHNKLSVPNGLTPVADRVTRIIRDADKIDILRLLAAHYREPVERRNPVVEMSLPDEPTVRADILDQLIDERSVVVDALANTTELKILQLSWLYDINYLWTFQVLEKRGYVKRVIETLPEALQRHVAVQKLLAFQAEKAEEAKIKGHRGR